MKSILKELVDVYKEIRKSPTKREGNSASTPAPIRKLGINKKPIGYFIIFVCIVALLAFSVIEYSETMKIMGLLISVILVFLVLLSFIILIINNLEILKKDKYIISLYLALIIIIISSLSYLIYYLISLIKGEVVSYIHTEYVWIDIINHFIIFGINRRHY